MYSDSIMPCLNNLDFYYSLFVYIHVCVQMKFHFTCVCVCVCVCSVMPTCFRIQRIGAIDHRSFFLLPGKGSCHWARVMEVETIYRGKCIMQCIIIIRCLYWRADHILNTLFVHNIMSKNNNLYVYMMYMYLVVQYL